MASSSEAVAKIEECLSHGIRWKSRFQNLLNELRKHKILPLQYLYRIGKKICTCEGAAVDPDWDDFEAEAWKTAQTFLDNYVERSDGNQEFASFLQLLLKRLRDDRIMTAGCESGKRFLLIMQQILKTDYSLLMPKQQRKNEVPDINHKFSLPGFKKENVGLLIGRRGNKLRPLLIEHKCYIKVDPGDEVVTVIVTTKSTNKDAVAKVEEELRTRAKEVMERRKKHQQATKEWEEEQEQLLQLELGNQPETEMGDQSENSLQNELEEQTENKVYSELGVGDQPQIELETEVGDQAQENMQIETKVFSELGGQPENEVKGEPGGTTQHKLQDDMEDYPENEMQDQLGDDVQGDLEEQLEKDVQDKLKIEPENEMESDQSETYSQSQDSQSEDEEDALIDSDRNPQRDRAALERQEEQSWFWGWLSKCNIL